MNNLLTTRTTMERLSNIEGVKHYKAVPRPAQGCVFSQQLQQSALLTKMRASVNHVLVTWLVVGCLPATTCIHTSRPSLSCTVLKRSYKPRHLQWWLDCCTVRCTHPMLALPPLLGQMY